MGPPRGCGWGLGAGAWTGSGTCEGDRSGMQSADWISSSIREAQSRNFSRRSVALEIRSSLIEFFLPFQMEGCGDTLSLGKCEKGDRKYLLWIAILSYPARYRGRG